MAKPGSVSGQSSRLMHHCGGHDSASGILGTDEAVIIPRSQKSVPGARHKSQYSSVVMRETQVRLNGTDKPAVADVVVTGIQSKV